MMNTVFQASVQGVARSIKGPHMGDVAKGASGQE